MNAPTFVVPAVKGAAPTASGQSKEQTRCSDQPVIACKDNRMFLRSLPDESMKLIVTSPPYNLGNATRLEHH